MRIPAPTGPGKTHCLQPLKSLPAATFGVRDIAPVLPHNRHMYWFSSCTALRSKLGPARVAAALRALDKGTRQAFSPVPMNVATLLVHYERQTGAGTVLSSKNNCALRGTTGQDRGSSARLVTGLAKVPV